jgi:hypothetical protein
MHKRRTHLKISAFHCSKISDSVLLFTAVKMHDSYSLHPVNGLKIYRLPLLKETLELRACAVCVRVHPY